MLIRIKIFHTIRLEIRMRAFANTSKEIFAERDRKYLSNETTRDNRTFRGQRIYAHSMRQTRVFRLRKKKKKINNKRKRRKRSLIFLKKMEDMKERNDPLRSDLW